MDTHNKMELNAKNVKRKISIVGLGTVGLTLAAAFGQYDEIIGYDIDEKRIEALKRHSDWNKMFSTETLKNLKVHYTTNAEDLKLADFHIVAVPTPVTADTEPDLRPLLGATKTLAQYIKKNDIVVYESSVYPGMTEEQCIPILEQLSKLNSNTDFCVGYSPERLNPMDNLHNFENVVKIVSAQNEKTLKIISAIYARVIPAGVFPVASIKVAEAAKIIENTQRDVSIALVNEVTAYLHALGINSKEVFEAARTKWNFIGVSPGLVGGNCIPVDPYYLIHQAHKRAINLDIISAARKVNESVPQYIVTQLNKLLEHQKKPLNEAKIAILGITFKEDFAELENSKVLDIIKKLQFLNVHIIVNDPVLDKKLVQEKYGLNLVDWKDIPKVDALIISVSHAQYRALAPEEYKSKFDGQGIIMDIKSILDPKDFVNSDITYWQF